MRIILFTILAILSSTVHAVDGIEYSAVLHLVSKHSRPGFNEKNLGIGMTMAKDNQFLMFGEFKNSLNQTSLYAGVGRDVYAIGPLSLSIVAGAITGYSIPVKVYVAPEFGINIGRTRTIFTYVPIFKEAKVASTIGVSLSIKF